MVQGLGRRFTARLKSAKELAASFTSDGLAHMGARRFTVYECAMKVRLIARQTQWWCLQNTSIGNEAITSGLAMIRIRARLHLLAKDTTDKEQV